MVLMVLVLVLSAGEGRAVPFYEGKTVTIIVGFGPGGGYDRLARLLAKYLTRHIPGHPRIIVQNMPGASTILAANYLFNIAKPDGLTIGSIERGLPLAQLLKAPGIKFDLRKFAWISSMAIEATVLGIRSDLPYKNFAEIKAAKSPLMLGITGPADQAAQFATLLKEFTGVNLKMISYPSNADIVLALERKEIDGFGGSYTSLKPYIERGLLRPIVRARLTEPGIETLPIDEDLTESEIGRTLMAIRSAPCRIGRPYVAPPGTSPESLKVLRQAFLNVTRDGALQEEAKKMGMPISYTSSSECLKVINYVLDQPPEIVQIIGKYLKF